MTRAVERAQRALIGGYRVLDTRLVHARKILQHQPEIHLRFGNLLVLSLRRQRCQGHVQRVARLQHRFDIAGRHSHQRGAHAGAYARGQQGRLHGTQFQAEFVELHGGLYVAAVLRLLLHAHGDLHEHFRFFKRRALQRLDSLQRCANLILGATARDHGPSRCADRRPGCASHPGRARPWAE